MKKRTLEPTIAGVYHKTRMPYIVCELRKDFHLGLEFYCEFCNRKHIHGRGEGHRSSHCTNPESPLKKTGYILVLSQRDRKKVKSQDSKYHFESIYSQNYCEGCKNFFRGRNTGQLYCSALCREKSLSRKYEEVTKVN